MKGARTTYEIERLAKQRENEATLVPHRNPRERKSQTERKGPWERESEVGQTTRKKREGMSRRRVESTRER